MIATREAAHIASDKHGRPVVRIKENDWVRQFYRGTDTTMAVVAGKGAGKTTVAAHWALREACKKQPGSQGLITFNTLQQARDAYKEFIKPLLEALNIPFNFNEQQLNLYLPNGSVVHLRSAEKDVVKRVETLQYSWWWGDECQDYAPDALKTFKSRVRKGLARIRITSMPTDPDAFLYRWLEEKVRCPLFELSLYDNPDKDFVEFYGKILEEIYGPEELKRYRDGERVSLEGMGLFAATKANRVNADYSPDLDLYLVWDFNVAYRAVTAWQKVGKKTITIEGEPGVVPVYNCVDHYQLKNFTTGQDAKDLTEYYRMHNTRIFLHGDASGDNRTAAASSSMWKQIKTKFENIFGNRIRYVVPPSNPPVKDTIQCTNWALKEGLLQFSDAAQIAYRYLVAAKSDKYGEIDKSRDDKEDGPKSHEVDTIRYLAWKVFKQYFPGAKSQTIKKARIKGM